MTLIPVGHANTNLAVFVLVDLAVLAERCGGGLVKLAACSRSPYQVKGRIVEAPSGTIKVPEQLSTISRRTSGTARAG